MNEEYEAVKRHWGDLVAEHRGLEAELAYLNELNEAYQLEYNAWNSKLPTDHSLDLRNAAKIKQRAITNKIARLTEYLEELKSDIDHHGNHLKKIEAEMEKNNA